MKEKENLNTYDKGQENTINRLVWEWLEVVSKSVLSPHFLNLSEQVCSLAMVVSASQMHVSLLEAGSSKHWLVL